MRYLTIGDHYVPASTFSHSLGRQPRFPMFAEGGVWKNQALAAKGSLRAWLRTHATGPISEVRGRPVFLTNHRQQFPPSAGGQPIPQRDPSDGQRQASSHAARYPPAAS